PGTRDCAPCSGAAVPVPPPGRRAYPDLPALPRWLASPVPATHLQSAIPPDSPVRPTYSRRTRSILPPAHDRGLLPASQSPRLFVPTIYSVPPPKLPAASYIR